MNQVGIPTYNDQVNTYELGEMKKAINALCLDFAKIYSKESQERRESEIFEEYTEQYRIDLANFQDMMVWLQKLINKINDTMYTISVRKIDERVWEVTNKKVNEKSV